eukprot:CAMPEP_0174737236 /NCGR_PEP_ID=MMETSP1094-20130205/68015_1 /TAXON_ID=156173 /ORGANISM="Chrysochromulina brevifilum, Strain UTEX LB 985" /LENGTH=118 /DNA_ID=CAMNT_0015940435 /DNA_START=12 /DNA_END=368 /DNA_ORIENTATION=+
MTQGLNRVSLIYIRVTRTAQQSQCKAAPSCLWRVLSINASNAGRTEPPPNSSLQAIHCIAFAGRSSLRVGRGSHVPASCLYMGEFGARDTSFRAARPSMLVSFSIGAAAHDEEVIVER